MAVVCYASTGSNTSPYETWAKAATSLATALAASTAGDTVQVDMANIASADSELSATTTWTIPAGVTLHIGTQNGASGITTGTMGTTYWLGNSTLSRQINIACSGAARIIGGLTLRQHGNNPITLNNTNGGFLYADHIRLWSSVTAGATGIHRIGGQGLLRTKITELILDYDRTSSTFAGVGFVGDVEIGTLTIESAGATVATGLFNDLDSFHSGTVTIHGGDLSAMGSGTTLIQDQSHVPTVYRLHNVILPASVVLLASQTKPLPSVEVYLQDCSSGGSAIPFAYANGVGEIRIDTGIYVTAAGAGRTWKITTNANAADHSPFLTPWFIEYKAAATVEATTEVLRDGSTTAYTDAQLWKETLSKQTTSSVLLTTDSTRGTGTNIPTGAGLGSWTGESGTAWSGEVTIGSKVLNEAGFHLSRFGFAVASDTVYVDVGPLA